MKKELNHEEKRIAREQVLKEAFQSYGIKNFKENLPNINYIQENPVVSKQENEDI